MKRISLGRGYFALVDDGEYPELSKFKWFAQITRNTVYAVRIGWDKVIKKQLTVYMHRQILACDSRVDHRDGNGLNNRRTNLRPASHAMNIANSRKCRARTSSKFKGVCFHRRRKKWASYITVNYQRIYLGHFDREEDAARAYNSSALFHFGEFARLNVIAEKVRGNLVR